ncbi:probable carboxylesterase 18 [Rhododendron vialii]|uniref:probable carboxylesterase 18 n=1 Tax=Rhododendron vialii TaxID=182163 RepID=UPI00265E4ABF|nr:probable carboxylesterase 18 [Rhododendron vialii]
MSVGIAREREREMAGGDSTARAAKPSIPWKTRLLIAGHTFAVDYSRRSNGTINRGLMNFLDAKAPASAKPIKGVTSSDITVDPSRNLWFRLYNVNPLAAAADESKLPIIVYFHGGGFSFFSSDTKPFDDFCRRLTSELPAVVVSVNYRLAPENRYPSQFDDGFDTLKFLDADEGLHLPQNVDLSRCFIAGDSAGGNIAHHVTLRAAMNHGEFKKLRLAGLIAMQPFFGGEERTESELRLTKVPFVNIERSDWSWRAFLPPGSNRDHEAANIFLGADVSGVEKYPATIVFVGGFDPLQDWQKRFYEWLSKSGKEAYLVEYPNAIHAFYGFPELPESSLLVAEVRNFIQKQSLTSP